MDINSAIQPGTASRVEALSLRWRLLAVLPAINVITGLAVAAVSGADSLGIAVLAAIGVATTISLELTLLLTRSIMQPLSDLQRATDAVRAGDYEVAVPVTTGDEIGDLAASFNDMVTGLRERERIRQAFGTYLDHDVAEYILSDGFSERGEVLDVSILFCDVKNFTSFAESAAASEVVACLNALFEVVVPEIAAEGGHVDKFEGDGLMAVFGAPQRFHDHADRALRAAVEIDRRVNREGEGGVFEIGIGVNTGPVVAGSIGGAGRLNFSVIGDAVNVAARVEQATRDTGDSVLITAATREELHEDCELEDRGERELRGLERPIALYALPAEPGDGAVSLPNAVDAMRSVYARVRGNRGED
jgi:class 3 adenylate cyclase